MTPLEQQAFDSAVEHAATQIKHALKDNIRQHPADFAPVLSKPNAIKALAGEAIKVLLDKAEEDANSADKGGALLITMGASFLVLNVEAISDKVVEIYNNDN